MHVTVPTPSDPPVVGDTLPVLWGDEVFTARVLEVRADTMDLELIGARLAVWAAQG